MYWFTIPNKIGTYKKSFITNLLMRVIFKILCSVLLLSCLLIGCLGEQLPNLPNNQTHVEQVNLSNTTTGLKKISSPAELEQLLKTKGSETGSPEFYITAGKRVMGKADAFSTPTTPGFDYSTTNIQVIGVDEPDIVKSDGEYLYIITKGKVHIVKAYPAEDAKIVATLNTTAEEIFINKNMLVLFESINYMTDFKCAENYRCTPPFYGANTIVEIYNISNRENPKLTDMFTYHGYYFDARMIEDYIYLIVTQPLRYYYYTNEKGENLQTLNFGDFGSEFPDMYYFDKTKQISAFAQVVAIDLKNHTQKSKVFLIGSPQDLFVSQKNIYLTNTMGSDTEIAKVGIKDGEIKPGAIGRVPGRVLNQFSMDEYNGYFRVATTSGRWGRWQDETNNIYVLNEKMEIVGKIENLAPKERIHSARFIGNKAYLVTFKKIDPLFVISLENPKEPKVLGKLKIPGYSDYLHPYDENHLIGIGKETVEAEQGDFVWYQGIKIALFDVSNVEKPKEIAKYNIGDRGTDSEVLRDHKAFLFSKEKGIMILPVLLAEIDEEKYEGKPPAYIHGDYVWQGAYVLEISPVKGINLQGRITHVKNADEFLKSGYYWGDSDYAILRSGYIEDVIYTISNSMLKFSRMKNLDDIKYIELN
ncbi:MAG: beta-propeller domain-containing protein [Candidatus Micrarchaeota archaeon]